MKATVFLGGGRITSALLAGLQLAQYDRPIVVHDRNPNKLRQLQRQYGVIVEPDLHRAVEAARILIIAVRPDSVRSLLQEIGRLGNHLPMLAVSLAAGVPLPQLRANLDPAVRWARAMPSPVCRSRKGLTALTFGREVSAAQRRNIRKLFSLVGAILEIPESRFDAFTVTYSSSHGYHALAAMIAAAEALGLDRRSARAAAAHALADGILAWREGRLSLHRLLHEAATPGGIAAAVTTALDREGFPRMIERGLGAGMKQARKNAKR